MVWLTDKTPILQSNIPNKIETLYNQVYYYKGNAYLIPRGLITDGYTIPLGIDKTKRDIRPSTLHDIGCKFHKLILIDLPLHVIMDKYTVDEDDMTVALDIPIKNLRVVKVSFNQCNNLLKESMKDCNIPKNIYNLYRLAVNFNLNWLFTGKENIDLSRLYKDKILT